MSPTIKSSLLAVCAGASIATLLPLPAPTLEVQWLPAGSTPTLLSSPEHPCPQLSTTERGLLDDAWTQRDDLQQTIATSQAALEPWIGNPPSFEDLPAHQQPERITGELQRHYDRRRTKIHVVDCVEAPCIVALELVGTDQHAMQSTAGPLQQAFGSTVQWQYRANEKRAFMTVPLGLPEDSDAVRHRINLRESVLLEELMRPRP